jgi:hypothetical protein
LIEFVGVLALLAILAVATAPVLIKKVDRDVWTKEVSELNTISNALALHALRSNSIPSGTTWSSVVTNWLTRSSSGVLTNSRNNRRLFLYDQSGWLNSVVPWTQSSSGAGLTGPSSARVVLLSTIGTPLPNTNGPLATANFNSIWNVSEGVVPTYLANLSWQGRADDLVIQRVSLDQMFHHLILTTRDSAGNAGYSINSRSSHSTVPNTPTGMDSYYLDGTTVGLWDGLTLTNSFILTRDLSFTYEGGMWQAQLTGGGQDNSILATNFAYQASLFVLAANVPGSHQGSDTQGLLSAFYSFMYGYTIWANECPHFQSPASSPGQQTDYQLLNALGANNGIIDSTAGSTGGGLLK